MRSVQKPRRKLPRRAIIIPIAMIGTAVMLWAGAASFVTWRLMHPPFLDNDLGDVFVASEKARASSKIGSGPKTFYEEVRVANRDAWFVPANGKSAVLLIPPSGASKRAMLPYLKFLHAANFPVLMIDSPDFGTGRAGWGWTGRKIVASAVALLKGKGFSKVGAIGVSAGAAASILAQSDGAHLDGIVSDSAFANLGAMLRHNPSLAGLNPAFLATVMWEFGLTLGKNPDAVSPESAALKIGDCALMVIQDRGDPITPASDGRAIYSRTTAIDREIWIAPTAGHGDAIYESPDEYARRVIDFLAKNLAASSIIVVPH
jgi:pimeloyl-ACP methyl ester carboxylesterase